jgi:D-aspartate ligase
MIGDKAMDFKGIRVLILEGYARQSLPLIKAFHKLGCHVAVLCSSKLDVGYASRYTDEKILGVCDREDMKATLEQVRKLLKTGNYDVVVPSVDFSAALLSENKIEFTQYAKVVSNDWDVYQIAGDKVQTMAICMDKGIPCPYTVLDVTTIEQVLNSDIKYPIVVKPRVGYGAIGFRKIDSKEELKNLFTDELDPSVYVFQEFIPQTDLQYECAMFVDNDNQVKTSLVFSKNRWFPVNGGSSTLNITVERPDIIESCSRLLKAINWRGAADIDLIQDPRDNTAKIMEINPRVSGSVKICFISGVDQARQMLELVYGREVTKYSKYRLGQRLRCSQTDLLWFIKSPNRFKSEPSWFSLKNTKDHIFSIDDPLPWFSYSLQAILRYNSEMSKRQGDKNN